MFFRRRSSLERREREWLAQLEKERVSLEKKIQSEQLEIGERQPALVDHTHVLHTEGPVHAQQVKKKPPLPPPRRPQGTNGDATQAQLPRPPPPRQPRDANGYAPQSQRLQSPPPSRQPTGTIIETLQHEQPAKLPPPPPRRQVWSAIVDVQGNESPSQPPLLPSSHATSDLVDAHQNESKPRPPPHPHQHPTRAIFDEQQNESTTHPPPGLSHRQPISDIVDAQQSNSKPRAPPSLGQPTNSGLVNAQECDSSPQPPPPPPPARSETRGCNSPSFSPAFEQRKESDTAVTRWRHRRPTGVRVAALVESWESMASRAEAEAARNASMLCEVDRTKLRAYFEQRRAEARALEKRSIVAVPQFANVARDLTEIVVEISAPGHSVQWCIAPSGVEKIERSMSWMTKRAPVRVRLNPGRFVVLARSMSDEGDFSEVTSAVFWFSPPSSIEHQLHALHALRWIDQEVIPTTTARSTTLRAICANCGKDLEKHQASRLKLERRACATVQARGRYACLDCQRFELCLDCALAAASSTSTSLTCRPKPTSHVALDSGGRRIWLSEPVAFEGNLTVIKPESHTILALLAGTLRRNPGLCIRLEGHANSNCGLDCDGTEPCSNDTCRALFGDGKGGAVGFTRARADAVRNWLLTEGGLDFDARERIVAVGLGGSRNLVDDTEGPENHLNRRVEAHIVDFISRADCDYARTL